VSLLKVFVETSPLLAASIFYNNGRIMHKSYCPSKSLFNFFKENLSLQIGITSDTVVTQAKSRLEKAITDCLRERQNLTIVELDLFSKVKDDSEDRLTENIKLLVGCHDLWPLS
jgi:hypothetical protein